MRVSRNVTTPGFAISPPFKPGTYHAHRDSRQIRLAYVSGQSAFSVVAEIVGGNRLYRLLPRQKRLAFRGPQTADPDQLLAAYPLDEVCAVQWQRCVEQAYDALQAMPSSRWIEVVYEDFVTDPGRELERVLAFLGLHPAGEAPDERDRQGSQGLA